MRPDFFPPFFNSNHIQAFKNTECSWKPNWISQRLCSINHPWTYSLPGWLMSAAKFLYPSQHDTSRLPFIWKRFRGTFRCKSHLRVREHYTAISTCRGVCVPPLLQLVGITQSVFRALRLAFNYPASIQNMIVVSISNSLNWVVSFCHFSWDGRLNPSCCGATIRYNQTNKSPRW